MMYAKTLTFPSSSAEAPDSDRRKGRYDVRRFRTAVTIALGVGIAAVLLAACSSNTPAASNTVGWNKGQWWHRDLG